MVQTLTHSTVPHNPIDGRTCRRSSNRWQTWGQRECQVRPRCSSTHRERIECRRPIVRDHRQAGMPELSYTRMYFFIIMCAVYGSGLGIWLKTIAKLRSGCAWYCGTKIYANVNAEFALDKFNTSRTNWMSSADHSESSAGGNVGTIININFLV